MSEMPAQGPWVGGEGRLKARAARRATDQLTVLMLLATAAVVAVAWFEPIQRLAEGTQLPAARRGIAGLVRARGWAVGKPEPTGHPRIRGGVLDPSNPLLAGPHEGHGGLELAPDGEGLDGSKLVANKPLQLRERADDSARVVITVEKGTRVRVVRDLDDWLLLVVPIGTRAVHGWIRRDDVTLP